MHTRSYALALLTAASGVLALTAGANVTIDPQGVFGIDVFPYHSSPNTRYRRFLGYRQEASRIDGLLFASSRGIGFDLRVLAERMDVGRVANFSVPLGLTADHLPFLEYILRDKASRDERIKAVLLVLDTDHFGRKPWTNVNIDSFLPAEVTGESRIRFWWRYLTAFQYRNWRAGIKDAWRGQKPRAMASDPERPPAVTGEPRPLRIVDRPDFGRQLALLSRFAALCKEHGARLQVATSPLSEVTMARVKTGELEFVLAEISRVVPVWDFKSPAWLGGRRDLWLDDSHYTVTVGNMMIERIYGSTESERGEFGQLRWQPASQN